MSKFTSTLLYTASLLTTSNTLGQTTLWVNDDNCPKPGTGTIVDPLCSIQRAIELSHSESEIVVMPGTYNELIDFLGKAIQLHSSDGADVTTIDGTGLNGSVVTCVSGEGQDTIFEGFTITGGVGTLVDIGRLGGGMFIYESGPTVIGCIFRGNTADAGSGLYNYFCNMTKITHCTFDGNHAAITGGGMYNFQCSPTVADCLFTHNSAENAGGGMRNNNSEANLRHCTFSNNSAQSGGGMANLGSTSPIVTHCTFNGNIASSTGGGMINSSGSSPTISNSEFIRNISTSQGGGMYNASASAIISGCKFYGNTTGSIGGGIYTDFGGHAMVKNSVFSGNTAQIGGGMSGYQSYQTVTNCTFSLNVADIRSGAIENSFGDTSVTHCILWDNTPDAFGHIDGSSSIITYSDILGGVPFGIRNGGGNIDLGPMFIRTPNPGAHDYGDLRLQGGSPCIDAGDKNFVAEFGASDLDGHSRVLCDVLDMGAYEFGIGDYDCDQTVTLHDFVAWVSCMTDPFSGSYNAGCEGFDFDGDNDVDMLDFGEFQKIIEP